MSQRLEKLQRPGNIMTKGPLHNQGFFCSLTDQVHRKVLVTHVHTVMEILPSSRTEAVAR